MSDSVIYKPPNRPNFILRSAASRLFALFACLSSATFAAALSSTTGIEQPQPKTSQYEVVQRYKHRQDAYTQGLLFDENGQLLESSGQYGHSNLVRLALDSGDQFEQQYSLPDRFFAEGAALFGNWLYLLTWRAGKCLVLDPKSLKPRHTLAYSGEGWGLTANDSALIMSDGSSELRFRQASTFDTLKTLAVKENGKPVNRLNELEWANDLIYANIWHSDDIVAIDPETGEVVHRIDLSQLRREEPRDAEALNGIAYHQPRDTFFVTGKYWSTIYEIKLSPSLPSSIRPKAPPSTGNPTPQ